MTYMHQSAYHHWFRLWIFTWLVPIHYLNQCWNIVNLMLGDKLQQNLIEEIEIYTYSYKKIHLKMSSWKWRPFSLNLNLLINKKPWPEQCWPCSIMLCRADSRFAPSQWETSWQSQWETPLQSNSVYHWLGTNLESALHMVSLVTQGVK